MMHQEKSEVSQYFSVFLWQAEPLKHYIYIYHEHVYLLI